MAIPNKSNNIADCLEIFCDKGIIFSLCAAVFVLPVSIALLDSFAGLAVFFYFFKKINRICLGWSLKAVSLDLCAKFNFIWKGLAPCLNCLNRPLQFLVAAFFISVVFSQYPGHSLFAFFGKFLKCVFVFFSFIEAFQNEDHIWVFLKCFGASAFITALSGATEHYRGTDFIRGHTVGAENFVSTQRINSTFFGANGFGAYLLPVIGLTAHFLYVLIVRRDKEGSTAGPATGRAAFYFYFHAFFE